MSVHVALGRVLQSLPLTGKAMLIFCIVATAVPTAMRAAMHDSRGDLCLYLPFVTLAAIVVQWRAAAAVAVVSGFLAAWLFGDARHQMFGMPCEAAGVIWFAVAAALIIGFAQAFRKALADPRWPNASKAAAPPAPVFSRKAGQACASWYGGRSFIPLGPADEVEAMMRDFLKQQEVGRRLTNPSERAELRAEAQRES